MHGADGEVVLAADEGIRPAMTAEDFASRPLLFAGDAAAHAGVGRRLPEVGDFPAVHSAATAPQMVDAAPVRAIGNRDAQHATAGPVIGAIPFVCQAAPGIFELPTLMPWSASSAGR